MRPAAGSVESNRPAPVADGLGVGVPGVLANGWMAVDGPGNADQCCLLNRRPNWCKPRPGERLGRQRGCCGSPGGSPGRALPVQVCELVGGGESLARRGAGSATRCWTGVVAAKASPTGDEVQRGTSSDLGLHEFLEASTLRSRSLEAKVTAWPRDLSARASWSAPRDGWPGNAVGGGGGADRDPSPAKLRPARLQRSRTRVRGRSGPTRRRRPTPRGRGRTGGGTLSASRADWDSGAGLVGCTAGRAA
jgi:hypothetical protein